jgi:hypothetical protein
MTYSGEIEVVVRMRWHVSGEVAGKKPTKKAILEALENDELDVLDEEQLEILEITNVGDNEENED